MDKKNFKVIKGKKNQPKNEKLTFTEAWVTNTRLMGVLGLRIRWQDKEGKSFYQFFHLDAEEYGIDDYIGLYEVTMDQVRVTTLQMMGGLGGIFVPVTKREVRYLLSTFAQKNRQYKIPFPQFEWEYIFLLKEKQPLTKEEIKNLWDRICEKINSPNQLINYYLMRAFGMDKEGMLYLSTREDIDYNPVRTSSTLLKNVIEKVEEEGAVSYLTESVIDAGSHYRMVLSEIKLDSNSAGYKVSDVQIKSSMYITDTEASFALNKKEYLLIYDVKDMGELMRQMDFQKPQAMKHGHENGYLYTEFNPTNAHVDSKIYYLNSDVYAVYYMTIADQLIVATYVPQRLEQLLNYFESPRFKNILDLEERIDLEHSVLYEFVNSEYGNFYDFLDEE